MVTALRSLAISSSEDAMRAYSMHVAGAMWTKMPLT
jgi:hypothetical protein